MLLVGSPEHLKKQRNYEEFLSPATFQNILSYEVASTIFFPRTAMDWQAQK